MLAEWTDAGTWIDWSKVLKAWSAGGWIMFPLAAVGLLCYGSAIQVLRFLWQRGHRDVDDRQLLQWIRRPERADGEIGEIIRYTQEEAESIEEIQLRFAEVSGTKIPEVDRRLQFVNVLVATAPLMGLLGTVLGMLTTFRGIALGGGKMVDTIARGISEALITTEMGLLIALPGLILSYWVRRKRNDYVAFLARVQSLTLQQFRRPRSGGDDGAGPWVSADASTDREDDGRGTLPSGLSPASA